MRSSVQALALLVVYTVGGIALTAGLLTLAGLLSGVGALINRIVR
jgi:hypothetical protein